MIFDKNGVLLADVPSAGTSNVASSTKSGNPRHDVRSGKFGAGGGGDQKAPPIPTPPNVDPLEFSRLKDAVRQAAREFDDFDQGDFVDFVKARAKDPNQVDLQAFVEMVKQQKLDDIVDILDQQLRKSGSLPTGKRKVRLTAPRGYLRKVIAGLDSDQLAEVMHRLEGHGHDQEEVDAFFDKHRPNNGDAKGKRNAIAASDQGWGQETLDGIIRVELVQHPDPSSETVIEMAGRIAEAIKPPIVHLEPQIVVQTPEKRVVHRDERGFISSIEDKYGED